VVSLSLLSLPYSTWERMDMKVCSSGPLGDSFLQEAALKGDIDQVKMLVAQGHNVNQVSGAGETPLGSSVRGGRVDVVRFLLAKGADVNNQNWLSDETPLMLAANSGDMEIIKALLDDGADPCKTLKYSDNETAQRIAEKKHNSAAAQYLASHSDCKLPPPLPTTCAEANSATCVEVH
jgi:ankyrin repeat protein